ncbi:hypothetical protein MKW98_028468 [Papaver atlanticum]|uniref:HXXXD-type acyl-transferase family protein n=1 Tax=Papaver atlanticum TaxID=357466 RepID=A0AAD4TGG9_9MAGN|nr:hypothetical protein MKW98_028468 [Papaver atlanticum]
MDDDVRYISTTTILPATNNHKDGDQKIHLGPWDLKSLLLPYMQRGLLFAHPTQNKQEEAEYMIITQLKRSLASTLDHFYPLAGRLAVKIHDDDNTVSFYIDCNSAGAEFIHASANITVADIMDSIHVPAILKNSFFTLNDAVNYDGRSKPLLSVQVTELLDGLFIGCSINHTVCDGKSFWHFFNSWCEISRQGSSSADHHISRPPIFDRLCLMNDIENDLPIRFPLSTVQSWEGYKYNPPPLFERVFIFTREKIAILKEKANSKTAKDDGNADVTISSLQAVLAHVWVAVIRARCLDPNEETRYRLAIGTTGRLDPPPPESFFGNSAVSGDATVKVHELLEVGGFELGALLLNKLVTSFDGAAIRSHWKGWVEKPTVKKMSNLSISQYTLVTGGSPRFDMYGNNFGWGTPIAVRSGIVNKRDGKITSTPGPIPGSIGIEACLSAKTLKALENDAEFMAAIATL